MGPEPAVSDKMGMCTILQDERIVSDWLHIIYLQMQGLCVL